MLAARFRTAERPDQRRDQKRPGHVSWGETAAAVDRERTRGDRAQGSPGEHGCLLFQQLFCRFFLPFLVFILSIICIYLSKEYCQLLAEHWF